MPESEKPEGDEANQEPSGSTTLTGSYALESEQSEEDENSSEPLRRIKQTGTGWMTNWLPFGQWKSDPTKRPVVSTEEVYALLEYAARKGEHKDKVRALSVVIHKLEPDPSEVAALYSDLVAETVPVNGGTLLDSNEDNWLRLVPISIATFAFFVLSVGNEIIDNWLSDLVPPEESGVWLNIKEYGWDYMTPFFWGGLVSCPSNSFT